MVRPRKGRDDLKTILVFGATGQQGGATARQLLSHHFKVRAFTRDPDSLSAKSLRELGAEIFRGDMENPSDLKKAATNVYGVFSVQPPSWSPTKESDEREANMGILVARAAALE